VRKMGTVPECKLAETKLPYGKCPYREMQVTWSLPSGGTKLGCAGPDCKFWMSTSQGKCYMVEHSVGSTTGVK
jgi:hypothetical protein